MKKIKILFFVFLTIFLNKSVFSYENSIVYKVDNEIITNYDLKKEINYLISLNPNLKSLKKDDVLKLAHQSAINEKIKKIELEKYFSLGVNPDDPAINIVLENIYKGMGIKNENEFREYLIQFNISMDWVKSKLEIESLWNNLIYNKYKNQVSVNEDKIRMELNSEIKSKQKKKQKQIFLSEILIKTTQEKNQESLIKEVQKSIEEIGFNNTANIYSISNTANKGGKIGWVNETSLSPKIQKELKNSKKGDTTQPIKLPSGYLILKTEELKSLKVNIDIKRALKNRIINEKNKQLDQLSTIYFNKIKKNIEIDG
tara:strand:+ start:19 stop:960 length:942 start_codon:yes stop_codon:yes gene_type:complete